MVTLEITNAQPLAPERERLFQSVSQHMIDTRFVTPVDNDYFIVAGMIRASRQAWATKIDADGNPVWTYTFDGLPEDSSAIGAAYTPQFTGAVGMSDGSTFLCGILPRPPDQYSPALLIHLDAAGRLLTRKLIIPTERSAHGIARFYDCIKSGDDIAIIGTVLHIRRAGEPAGALPAGLAYWALTVDREAKIVSESQLPSALSSKVPTIGPLLHLSGDASDLIFAAADQLFTEILRFNSDKDLQVAKKLQGQFLLVRPVIPDKKLQIFGRLNDQSAAHVTILFNERLEELYRADVPHFANFVASVIFRLPDQTLALFGSQLQADGRYTPRAIHAAADLQSEQHIDFSVIGNVDRGLIWAAAPSSSPNQFVIAAPASKRKAAGADPEPALTSFGSGVAIDFIRFR